MKVHDIVRAYTGDYYGKEGQIVDYKMDDFDEYNDHYYVDFGDGEKIDFLASELGVIYEAPEAINVKIVNQSKNPLPSYATISSAGMDLYANIESPIMLQPLDRYLFPTGIFIALPIGFEAQIRPRSGLACKHGITVSNSPGTIDADYRGEIKVSLTNLSNETYTIQPGERIAQMVVAKHERVEWNEVGNVEALGVTVRGDGGFGHSGTKEITK